MQQLKCKFRKILTPLCINRRSAGIPYLIQAIVSTEPQTTNYASLNLALKKLMELCQDSREEVRIHAYNILRILFRDSSLGEVVSPFISDGLRAAIGGFKASQWPVSILLVITSDSQKLEPHIYLCDFMNIFALYICVVSD